MEPAWDHVTFRAWFEARAGEDVLETELLKAFFPDDDGLAQGVSLELFQKHFLLYRRLWLFDDELAASTGQRLWIRGIRSTLLEPPPPGRCRWLDPETGRYCLDGASGSLCSRHAEPVPEPLGMRAYYLDETNLEGMTEEGLRTLMDGFWRWMGGEKGVNRALETLGLPPEANARAIKARWRQLSLQHHPDRGGDAVHYQNLSAAWAVLKSRT